MTWRVEKYNETDSLCRIRDKETGEIVCEEVPKKFAYKIAKTMELLKAVENSFEVFNEFWTECDECMNEQNAKEAFQDCADLVGSIGRKGLPDGFKEIVWR